MSAKTIFIIIITILVTIILVKNTDDVDFWIFGEVSIPKLAVLGVFFALGLIVGLMIGRPRKKLIAAELPEDDIQTGRPQLSDEDKDYIN